MSNGHDVCGGFPPTFSPDTTAGVTLAQVGDNGVRITANYLATPADTNWVFEVYRKVGADPVPGTDAPVITVDIDPLLIIKIIDDLGLEIDNTYHYILRVKCKYSLLVGQSSIVDIITLPPTLVPTSDITWSSGNPPGNPGLPPGDPPPIPPTNVYFESIDEHIWLVKPTKGITGYTFEDKKCLTNIYQRVEWWYYRNGGCGHFRLFLRQPLDNPKEVVDGGWEIHLRLMLPGETVYTTWYRGVIRAVEDKSAGQEAIIEIRGQGYMEQLASIQVQRRYPKNSTIKQIVDDIVDNYVKPDSRIVRVKDVPYNSLTGGANYAATDTGVDASDYVTKGPIHFECSALTAIKFLSELQGDREFGVDAYRRFYFRAKINTVSNALFKDEDTTAVVKAFKQDWKANTLKVEGKQWGHRETLKVVKDVSDVTAYGLFERPIEVPWLEHDDDSLRWAENIINWRKGTQQWDQVDWTRIDKHLERTHPLGKTRVYGSDVSSDYADLHLGKVKYVKGGFTNRGESTEIGQPRIQIKLDQPQLRATFYFGIWQNDLLEDFEDKHFNQIAAIKGKHKQFRNPGRDCTLPDPSDISLWPGMLWSLPTEPFVYFDVTRDMTVSLCDVTLARHSLWYWDVTEWHQLIGQRFQDATTTGRPGHFPGEEIFIYSNPPTRTKGKKYYWNGENWELIEKPPAASTGGSGTVTSVGLSLPSQFTVSDSPVTISGTLTAALATQLANLIFAGPSSGAAAAPAFRALIAADIPNLDTSKITSGVLLVAQGGTGIATTTAFAQTILDDANAAAVRATIGAGTGDGTVTSVTGTLPIVSSGGVTPAISLNDTAVTPASYTYASITVDAKGRLTAASSGAAPVTSVTGTAPIASTGGTDPAISLNDDGITDLKLRDSSALSVIGRAANTVGDPADIATTAASAAVLRESGSVLGFGTVATAGIANDAITNTKLADMAVDTVKGRATAGTGDPEDLALTSAGRALIDDTDAAAQRTTLGLGAMAVVNSPVPIANGGTNSTTALNNSRVMVSVTGAIVEAGAMTNGQILIGSTGAAPVVATITAGTNIAVTNAAGSITIAVTGGSESAANNVLRHERF